MHFRWPCIVLGLIAMSTVSQTLAADPPKLIPREILFGNPERTSPQLSPDGKYVAFIAPDDRNVLQAWVRTLGQKDDRKLTNDQKRGVRQFTWAYDGEHLCYLQDTDGDENFHLYAVNLKTNATRDLTPFKGVRVQGIERDPKFPNELIVGMNKNNPAKFDAYRLNLASGEAVLDTENPGTVLAWTTDPQFKVRAATAASMDGGFDLMYREAVDKPWKVIRHWGPDDEGSAVGFSGDGTKLYVIGNHDANTQRLIAIDLANMKETVLSEDPSYDVGGVMVHPTKRNVQAVSYVRAKVEWVPLDPSVKEDFDVLRQMHKGQFNVVSRDLQDRTWLVSYLTDDGPVYYFVYDREAKKGTLLFSHQPKLEGLPLAPMKPISFKSRDGLTIHGYLTTPVGVEPKNLPTVLLVHGGPWARDNWGYNPLHQWLQNRGYAVLSVNFRGSTGYGKKFLNAGNREWGAKMHDDLIDAVQWLVKEGVADPKKIAIMGGSYGGYATLVGLTFTPDVFACGVDIVGPSNIVSLLQTIPPYWGPMRKMFAQRVGDLEKEEEFLKSRSPLFRVDKIKAPLLIAQGANDPRVKQAESDQIVAALRKANKQVDYVVYTDEGHGFARPENNLHFFGVAEEFLARHLGGRYEPLLEIKGHSGVVK